MAVSAHSIMPAPAQGPTARPNVLLIGMDSFRDDLVDTGSRRMSHRNAEAFMKAGRASRMRSRRWRAPFLRCVHADRPPSASHGRDHESAAARRESTTANRCRACCRARDTTRVYATDEVRFANIDSWFGFQQTITPPIGASEFLIEKLVDTRRSPNPAGQHRGSAAGCFRMPMPIAALRTPTIRTPSWNASTRGATAHAAAVLHRAPHAGPLALHLGGCTRQRCTMTRPGALAAVLPVARKRVRSADWRHPRSAAQRKGVLRERHRHRLFGPRRAFGPRPGRWCLTTTRC